MIMNLAKDILCHLVICIAKREILPPGNSCSGIARPRDIVNRLMNHFRAEIVRNATWRDRALHHVRRRVIGWLGGYDGTSAVKAA